MQTSAWAFLAASELDLGNFNAEANHCDEIVQTSPIGGGMRLPQDHFIGEGAKTYKYPPTPPNREHDGSGGTKTVSAAITIDSDTLGFDTGDRVMVSGNALPPPLVTNTSYYVIRQSDGNDYILQQLNVHRSPVIQLAATPGGPPITLTGNGSGTIWALDRFWLLSTDTAGLATGDFVQVYQADGNPLPAPLVNGGSYYWIDRGHQQVYYETTHGLLAYGSGMLAFTEAQARALQPITLTTVGLGNYLVYKQYQKRFTCNGVVDTAAKPADIIASLLSSCGGKLVRSGDKWRLQTAVWRGVTQTLVAEKHARAAIKVNTLVSKRDLFNAVRGTYITPGNFDQPSDFPPYPDPLRPDLDIFLAEDGGERIWSNDIQLPFTNTPSMAQRLAKIMLMQVRKQISIIFPANLSAIGITVGDVCQVSSIRMGWSNKTFECIDWTFVLDGGGSGEAPTPGIDLTLRETDPACFEWQNGAETTGWWAPRTNLPSVFNVPTPALVSVVEERYVTAPGAGTASRAHITWAPIADGFTGYYQLAQWDAATGAIGYETPQTSSTGTEIILGPLQPGHTFCFAVRAINIFGVSSAWSAPLCVAIQGNTTAPPDIVNFRVEAISNHAHVTWAQSMDLDVLNGGHIELRWNSATVGATWPTATGLQLLLAGTATEATVFLKAGTYMAKAINNSGKTSVNAVVWILKIVDQPGWVPAIVTTESPVYPGTKTNLIVSSGNLQLAIIPGDSANIDSWTDVDSVPDWDSTGSIYPDGEYDFSTIIDLGGVYTFRIDLDVNSSQIGASAFGEMATARIKSQIATTYDPPLTGTPTWSDWGPYLIGDFTARGIKRRLLFHSDEKHSSIAASYLRETLSLFTRNFTKQNVAIAVAGTTVAFTPAFYAPPITWGNVVSPAVAGNQVIFSSVTRNGGIYKIVNSSGTSIGGTADIYAFGSGSQLA